MKKTLSSLLLILITILLSAPVTAQIPNVKKVDDEKPVIIRDRFMLDFFHTYWTGTSKEMKASTKFQPGFNIAGMYDFRLPNKSPLSFGLGIGFSYYTMYNAATLGIDSTQRTVFTAIPEEVSFKRSKMIYTNIHIPLEFRYRHSNGFKISLGVRLGLVTGITTKYKGNDPLNANESLNFKNFDIRNKQKFNFDVYLRTGWKAIGVYFSYQVNSLFTKDNGPQIHPLSMGLTLNFF
ncbi:MAG: PorT family protein [Bacteroidales bacterium]|nr:PorT family protein [Bacteroidales bacterium]